MTTAYFTFDRDLLDEVESFYWDPEIGVDFLQVDEDGDDGEGEGESEGEGEESPEGKKKTFF